MLVVLLPTVRWMGRHPATPTIVGPVGLWPAWTAIVAYVLALATLAAIRLPRTIAAMLYAAAAAMLASGALSHGLRGLNLVIHYILLTAVPVAIVLTLTLPKLVASPRRLFWLLPPAGLAAVQLAIGPRWLTDFGLLAIAFALLLTSSRFRGAVLKLGAPSEDRAVGYARAAKLALVVLLACWSLAVPADVLTRLLRPAPQASTPEPALSQTGPRIGITLSGGGYRAALFHAGVLRGLRRQGIPTHVVATVSGGSIIGAFYAFGGSPDRFVELVTDGQFNLLREIGQLPNFVRMLAGIKIPDSDVPIAPFPVTRTHLQARLLDRLLFHGARLADHAGAPNLPELILCAADLRTGAAVGLTRAGFVWVPLTSWYERFDHRRYGTEPQPEFVRAEESRLPGDLPVADLVAASGAFPGALEPLDLDDSDWTPMTLVDGGLVDNYGITLMRAIDAMGRDAQTKATIDLSPWRADQIIVSDGSALDSEVNVSSLFTQLKRTMDVVYRFTGPRDAAEPNDPRLVVLSPRLLFLPGMTSESLQWGTPAALEVDVGVAMFQAQAPPSTPAHFLGRVASRNDFLAHMGRPLVHRLVRWMTPVEKRCFAELLDQMDQPGDAPPPVCAQAGVPSRHASPLSRDRPLPDPTGPWGLVPEPATPWGPGSITPHLLALMGRHTATGIQSFAGVSTLADQISPNVAAAIVDLGEALAYVKRNELTAVMTGAQGSRIPPVAVRGRQDGGSPASSTTSCRKSSCTPEGWGADQR